MRRMDTGSEPFFGDFTVVFNSALAPVLIPLQPQAAA